jgi:acetolactate synthase-1/2/3 large subunit
MPDDGIVLPDVGVHHNWVIQFWRARRPRTLLNTWGFGAMGFGVCGVLGAKLAAPDRPCVAVCGDGGFMMRPDVLCTAVEYDIPAVWVIWNNFAYGAIRDIQMGMFAKREIATSFVREKDGRLVNRTSWRWARAARTASAWSARVPGGSAGARHQVRARSCWTCTWTGVRPPWACGSCLHAYGSPRSASGG